MSTIRLTVRRINAMHPHISGKTFDQSIKVECEMDEAGMREAFAAFLATVTEDEFAGWMAQLAPDWAPREVAA